VIRALASELGLDIAVLDIGRAGLGDEALRQAMATAPKGAILAIEDIDAAFRQRKKGEAVSGVTFSGLLNTIDGVAAQEGRALVMTTNHPERLDPALSRPGRVDMHVELGLIGAGTSARLFAGFFPDRPDLVPGFEAALGARRFTPAALQAWLLAHAEAAAGAAGLIPEPMNAAMAAE
jgi:chaperone BCS1